MVALTADNREVAPAQFAMQQFQPIKIDIIDPTSDSTWDARIEKIPGCSVFHSSGWARVLRESYGYKPRYFVGHVDGRLCAVLPVMEVDSWLTGRRGVALPFTDECPPLVSSETAWEPLLTSVQQHGLQRRWRYLERRGGILTRDNEVAEQSFWGHRLSLTTDENQLFARADGAVRQGIRKAARNAVEVSTCDSLSGMREFYRLHCLTRARHGVPPQPFRFFALIQRWLLQNNHGKIFLASHHGKTIAGAVLLQFGRQAIYKFAASDFRYQHLRGNNVVLWEAIRHYARCGLETLHLGRTAASDVGLLRFKRSWGAEEYRINYYTSIARARNTPSILHESATWQQRLFRTLPIGLSRLIGAVLYRHIG